MIAVNFMFVMVEHNPFVGVKMVCYGMKRKLDVVHKVVHRVLVDERNGDKIKVEIDWIDFDRWWKRIFRYNNNDARIDNE